MKTPDFEFDWILSDVNTIECTRCGECEPIFTAGINFVKKHSKCEPIKNISEETHKMLVSSLENFEEGRVGGAFNPNEFPEPVSAAEKSVGNKHPISYLEKHVKEICGRDVCLHALNIPCDDCK